MVTGIQINIQALDACLRKYGYSPTVEDPGGWDPGGWDPGRLRGYYVANSPFNFFAYSKLSGSKLSIVFFTHTPCMHE